MSWMLQLRYCHRWHPHDKLLFKVWACCRVSGHHYNKRKFSPTKRHNQIWEIYQKLNPMSESTSNIKSVTYISYSKSNLIQILRNNSKEKEGSHTLLFLKVFIVEGVWGHYFTIFFSSYTPILYKSFTLKLYIFSKIFH